MAEKILNTRIQLKYDSWEAWSDTSKPNQGANLILKAGEIGICEIPSVNGDSRVAPTVLFKVGGTKYPPDHEKAGQLMAFKDLPWASAKAADVYTWAKRSEGEFIDNFLSMVASDGKTMEEKLDEVFATDDQLKEISDIVSDGVGVMSVSPAPDSAIQISGTEKDPIVDVALNATSGNVILTKKGGLKANIDLSGYKVKQEAVASPSVTDEAVLEFISDISQNEQGVISAVKKKITAAKLGLTGAMHFLGITTTEIMDGSTEWPLIGSERREPHIGDVVIYNNKEFVWCLQKDEVGEMDAWEELGDGSSYALKTYTITAGEGLEGGSELQYNPSLKIADNGVTTSKIADQSVTTSKIANNSITIGKIATTLAEQINNTITEVSKLVPIAKTGNINDLVQTNGDIIIFYCGTSTENI